MRQHYALSALLSALVVVGFIYAGLISFRGAGLPFNTTFTDAQTGVVGPIQGVPLPAGMRAGDHIDLSALSPAARESLVSWLITNAYLPAGQEFDFVINRGGTHLTVPVAATTDFLALGFGRWFSWTTFLYSSLLSIILLLLIWRGHDRAARGMTVWVMAMLFGTAVASIPEYGASGMILLLIDIGFWIIGRIGFYVVFESMLGSSLISVQRNLFRAGFLVILTAGMIQQLGGVFLFINYGWAGLLLPEFGLIFTAGYLWPLLMLFLSYRRVEYGQRKRLRWLMWSGVIWVVGISLGNTPIPDVLMSFLISNTFYPIALFGVLYAILRHRVVDVSIVLDRTLVYGAVTALVIGALAAVNNLVQHAALGTNASLIVQIAVPLALGIVLSRVRSYIAMFVGRVFFRKKYLAEKELRRFARHCGKYEQANHLFEAAVGEVRRQLGAVGCAIYERKGKDYVGICQEGEVAFPASCGIDDPAFVAARSEHRDTNLAALHSELGKDGYVFPMRALDVLQGVLVCANRPGEHYAADERKLLTYVAHQMGLALYALRMRARDKLIDAMASGTLSVSPEIQAKARALIYITE